MSFHDAMLLATAELAPIGLLIVCVIAIIIS